MNPTPTASNADSIDLLDLLPALVAYIDADGIYRRMSRSYERWCGIRREDYLGRHQSEVVREIFGTNYAQTSAPHIRRALEGCATEFESRIRNHESTRDVRISYAPDVDTEGTVRGTAVLVADITDLKRAEQETRQTAEHLRIAAEAGNMGFWEYDPASGIIHWNWSCMRVLGLTDAGDAPSYEDWSSHIHPQDRQVRDVAIRRSLETGEPYTAQYRFLLQDGSWKWIHSRGRMISTADGQPRRAIGVAYDITELKEAEERVARQSERIDQILRSTTDGVFMLDREFRFTYMNARAQTDLGNGSELIGLSVWDAFPLSGQTRFGEAMRSTMAERVPTHMEEYYPAPLNRWFEVHHYPTEEGLAGFVRDVTERHMAEEALRLQQQAISAVPVGITIARYDQEGDYPLVYANPAFAQITGYAADEILGRNCRFLQGANTDEETRTRMRESLRRGEPTRAVIQNYRKDGTEFVNELSISPVRNDAGEITHLVGIQNDVTERIVAGQRLTRQAQYDALTGFPNRSLFLELLKQSLRTSTRRKDREVALVYIDVDNLKHVNERLGHQGGDRYLRHIAQRISSAVRDGDIVARIGGDEFAILLTDFSSRADVEKLLDRILRKVSAPLRIAGRELVATISAGYAVAPSDAAEAEDLLRSADVAMYAAKRECRNAWKAYRPAMDSGNRQLLDVAAGLRQALRKNEFTLAWQPRIEATSGRLHSMEALIRWQHPERGVIFPGAFIPVAEETGLIVEIGHWVMQEAVRQIGDWRARGFSVIPVSVNVSALQFRNPAFPASIRKVLQDGEVAADLLEIELTESVFMDETVSTDLLQSLRDIGVRIAIDDFGTGYSGLGYLRRFTVDILKVDRAFTASIEEDQTAGSVCRSILQLAQELHLTTVAEGVETAAQAVLLREWGCDQLQGYYFGRPVCADEIEKMLARSEIPQTTEQSAALPAIVLA